ncbi:hypothetical protein C1I93_23805 [Micromonospora endophytica]|uniref:Uncharacterized protein n=1 Tax=Micromonospora endophytica TaxID=515350 RepID=A0A2W2CMH6_9ACTN|nr:hypothetical protein C1I93_23805 [Micromonospora endophytica]
MDSGGFGPRSVNLPLNEVCWLGMPYVDRRYGGEPYQQEMVAYTTRRRLLAEHRPDPRHRGGGVRPVRGTVPGR